MGRNVTVWAVGLCGLLWQSAQAQTNAIQTHPLSINVAKLFYSANYSYYELAVTLNAGRPKAVYCKDKSDEINEMLTSINNLDSSIYAQKAGSVEIKAALDHIFDGLVNMLDAVKYSCSESYQSKDITTKLLLSVAKLNLEIANIYRSK